MLANQFWDLDTPARQHSRVCDLTFFSTAVEQYILVTFPPAACDWMFKERHQAGEVLTILSVAMPAGFLPEHEHATAHNNHAWQQSMTTTHDNRTWQPHMTTTHGNHVCPCGGPLLPGLEYCYAGD